MLKLLQSRKSCIDLFLQNKATVVNCTIHYEDLHLEIGDMVYGYCTVRALKYCIIIHHFWGDFGHHV